MARLRKQNVPLSKAAATADGATAIIVTGPKKGRWRAGRYFTAESTLIELAELTDDELATIAADPALTVVEAPAAAADVQAPIVPGPEAPTSQSGTDPSTGA